ncbi:MAG: hypothetical protein WCF60_18155 [Anaerobacillus sp.]
MVTKMIAHLSWIYNLLLALGAIGLGVLMYTGKAGFSTFPQEWLDKVPFTSWASIGLIGIIIFGIGNAIAFVYSFKNIGKKIDLLTVIMGIILLLTLVTQRFLLQEWYLATMELMVVSLIQIMLGSFGIRYTMKAM